MTSIRSTLLAAAMMWPAAAQAQNAPWAPPQPPPEFAQAYGSVQFLRIQVSFRAPLQAMATEIDVDATMLEKARRALYGQAQRECAVLSEAFNKAECRLSDLQVEPGSFIMANTAQPPQLFAKATFLLKLKSDLAGR